MKAEIHPTYYTEAKVVCSCGNTFTTGSTKPEIHVEICCNCHPFFTGSEKFVDTEGRVEKFQRKAKEAAEIKEAASSKKQQKQIKKPVERPTSLKEMMQMLQKQRQQ